MQIVFGEEINAESFEKAKAVRPEYCVAVTGEVVLREAPNASMETGMVELKCESIKVLSESQPFCACAESTPVPASRKIAMVL